MLPRILGNLCSKNKINNFYNVVTFLSTKAIRSNTPRLPKTHFQNRFVIARRSYATKMPKTPELIYIPHLTRWLRTKFQLRRLQRTWDPEFTEGSFIYGTSKAVCRITEIIHDNKPKELEGLLTSSAIIKLTDDMATKLTKLQKKIIKINPEDIKILVPTAVHLSTDGDKRTCRVGMRVLALKWIQQTNGALRLVLIVLQTEFLKYYKEKSNSDWTISSFDVLECAVLTQTPH